MTWLRFLFSGLVMCLTVTWALERPALLLIANKADDTLLFVDPKTLTVVGTTPTGRGPHEVTVTPNGKWAFVANYEGPADNISVIDVVKMRAWRKILIPAPHFAPHGLAVSKDGTTLYVTCEGSQVVLEIDVATLKISREVKTDQRGTHMLVLTSDGTKLYTANIGDGSVTVIDLAKGEVIAQMLTGSGCEGIDVTPDGKQVWTTNAAGTLSIIDTATDTVVDTLVCRGFPIRVKITPDGKRAVVACMRANEVAIFDVGGQRKEVARLTTGTAPVGIVIEPEGKRAYVANTGENTVTVLDLKTLTVVGKMPTGRIPDGMVFVPTR